MPDIRYVIISDMHLGAENSVLTHIADNSVETDTSQPSGTLMALAACVRELVANNKGTRKPALVFNGDLMELALTTTNVAVMAFQRAIELLMPIGKEPIFDNEIIYLPGNHDHNLWERARSHHYIECLRQESYDVEEKEEVTHTKLIDPQPLPATLLTTVIQRYPHLQNFHVSMNYPARAIISDNGERCMILCHGHYVESIYLLMTTLRSQIFPNRKPPESLVELEKENYAWIDFFWSTLGRSGSVGRDINLIYDQLQDYGHVKKLLHNIANSYAMKAKHFFWRWTRHHVMEELLLATIRKLAESERKEPNVALTPDAIEGLKVLMEKYLLTELKAELGQEKIPHEVTFIFGHTHKPFQQTNHYKGYLKPVKIYNSGGWVVDTLKKQPLHGGAVILVDETLDTLAVQMYREGNTDITVEQADSEGNISKNEFYNHINSIIDMKREPWLSFAEQAQKAVTRRYGALAAIIASED